MEGAEPNEGPWILRTNWTLYALSSVVLALRAFTQIKTRKLLELDDWLMFLAFVSIRETPPLLGDILPSDTACPNSWKLRFAAS